MGEIFYCDTGPPRRTDAVRHGGRKFARALAGNKSWIETHQVGLSMTDKRCRPAARTGTDRQTEKQYH